MVNTRHYTPADHLVIQFDQALRTLLGRAHTTERRNPADELPEAALTEAERDLAARLMRVNHAGEVSAQGLYQGQALTARLESVREEMERAAAEENDHLAWCEQRVNELGGRLSLLNPAWYAGAFAIGAAAGLAGDRWSLGFVAETERQVVEHLDGHLARLPATDARSRAILEQMREDEARHGTAAEHAGGAALPAPVRGLMRLASRMMTGTAHYL
jgi:3-demethoxyubiquinol 3-hydroxylase